MSNNKVLITNTVALYIRTGIVMLLSFFLTRLLLKNLGVEDFGIYSVVGSIILFFSFLNSGVTQSIQRFASYEIGRGEEDKIPLIVSVSIILQLVLITVLATVGYFVGMWYITNKLNIPPNRLDATIFVFYNTIFVFAVNIFKAPFEAIVISYERLKVYAYFSIWDVIVKLIIVILIGHSDYDRLCLYALLLSIESFILLLINAIYCFRSGLIKRIILPKDYNYALRIAKFSLWTAIGSLANILTQNGIVFIVNFFYGVIANAAMGISNQVSAAISSFVTSFQTSFRPQIVKTFANGEKESLHLLVCRTSKFSFCLMILPTIIILLNIEYILQLWLSDIPTDTQWLCRFIIISCLCDGITGSFNCAITATGKIRSYQTFISTSFLLDLGLTFLFAYGGLLFKYIFITRILTRGFLNGVIGLIFLRRMLNFSITCYFNTVLVRILTYMTIVLIGVCPLLYIFHGFSLLVLSTTMIIILGIPLMYIIMLSHSERIYIKDKIKILKNTYL